MLLVGNVVTAAPHAVVYPLLIEVFTTTDSPVTGEGTISQPPSDGEIELHIYELDCIQKIEAALSADLPPDPRAAQHMALQRIQQMGEVARTRMQRAAMGLAKAVQYGIDRYPAIVFDGELVVYGMTDIRAALHRYQQWQEGGK